MIHEAYKRILVLEAGLEPAQPQWPKVLSPSCLPFHHSSIFSKKERKTRLELATATLGKVMLLQLSYFRVFSNGCKDK